MTQTDRIIGNISAIKTLIENFPMSLLDGEGKTYTSGFEFIMDVLRACGISDEIVIDFLLDKIYGVEGQPGYSINGLYELLKSNKLDINPQNQFIDAIENSIKVVLMGLFTSLFTCSALPVLPNRVFDRDDLAYLMKPEIAQLTTESTYNDDRYKIKLPINAIDIMNMLSISPLTVYGSLYYNTGGQDSFYKKVKIQKSYKDVQERLVPEGEEYETSAYTYTNDVSVTFRQIGTASVSGKTFDVWDFNLSEPLTDDIELVVHIKPPGDEQMYDYRMVIMSGETSSSPTSLLQCNPSETINGTEKFGYIEKITINGTMHGGELVNGNGEKTWVYLEKTNNDGFDHWTHQGGKLGDDVGYGEDKSDEIEYVKLVSDGTAVVNELVDVYYDVYTYQKCTRDEAGTKYVRNAYVPNESDINENSPDFIACYDGPNPNLLYRTFDMNAFIWYVINRGKKSNQIEKNHLMWDSRVSSSKKGVQRNTAEDWNSWYASKREEGEELEFLGDNETDNIYPIIQIEKGVNKSEVLVRIPSQRYFLPKKREKIIDGSYELNDNTIFFNASIYKFDWEYLQSIQILNPRLLLVRFVENLIGFSIDAARTTSMGFVRNEIKAKLSSAIMDIIEADDMEVENCYKTFSNDDFDDLLNELMLSKYTASEYNGESMKARVHNANEYASMLDAVNENAGTSGTITHVKRLVNKVMIDPGTEGTTEWNFDGHFDSNLLKKFLWAMVMPIIESLFTPQVMLLVMINFDLLGIVKFDEALTNNFGLICNLMLNKILGLMKSIIRLIKDKIEELLLELFKKHVMILLIRYMLLEYLEAITAWLLVLSDAVKCIALSLFGGTRYVGYVEDVDYADIVPGQTSIPETQSEC